MPLLRLNKESCQPSKSEPELLFWTDAHPCPVSTRLQTNLQPIVMRPAQETSCSTSFTEKALRDQLLSRRQQKLSPHLSSSKWYQSRISNYYSLKLEAAKGSTRKRCSNFASMPRADSLDNQRNIKQTDVQYKHWNSTEMPSLRLNKESCQQI